MKHPIASCLSLLLLLVLCLISVAFSEREPDKDASGDLLLPSKSSADAKNDSLVTVVCAAESEPPPNGTNSTHHYIIDRPSTDQFIRLKFNGTLGAIPRSSDFMGSGLDRVKVLDMSHQNIRSISPSDSDTFQMFRESIMSINLTFNAIVNVDVHAFDNFTPLRAVQVDLTGNADIPCHQMCLLSSLKRPHIEYKGECTGTDGERISFSSHSNPLNCQDLKVDATDPSNAVQSAVKVSYDGPSAAVYAGIGLVVCGIFAVCIFTAAAFLIIRRRKRTRKQENPRKVSRRVVNMNANPLYEERMMSGSSGMFGMSRSSENILYSTSERPKPELPSNVNLAYTREDESSCEFHIYEEADAVTGIRNVQNPIYDGSSD